MLDRRTMLIGRAAACAVAPRRAFTQNVRPKIAIAEFVAGAPEEGAIARAVTQLIAGDLRGGERVALLDPASPAVRPLDPDAVPRFEKWRARETAALVTGLVAAAPGGRIRIEFRLWEVAAGRHLLGRQYFTTREQWPRAAHAVSDTVYSG